MLLAFAAAQLRSYLREPLALGWTVLFPALLLLILGTLDASPPERALRAREAGGQTDRVFLLMGIVGMNVASIGLFGLGLVLVQLRAIGFFRRLAMTPQFPGLFIAGQLLAAAVVVFSTTFVLLVTGALALGIQLPARPLHWCGFLALGTGAFLGIGFALAATVREPRTAQMLGNLAFLILVILGGIWYPIDVLPDLLRWLSLFLPLPHLLGALRQTAMPQHDSLDLGMAATVLAAWCLGALLVSVVRFRWRDPR
jgi:ABC-2 type transport system permease protein